MADIIEPLIQIGPEMFLPITENIVPEIMNYYTVSNYGRVFSTRSRKEMTAVLQHRYYYVPLARKYSSSTYPIHRLVLCTFSNTPIYTSFEVNHVDGDRSNNFLYNLEFATHYENMRHWSTGERSGRARCSGEQSQGSIMTEEDARQIGVLLEQGMSMPDIVSIISKSYITTSMVCAIKNGTSWYVQSGARESQFLIPILVRYFGRNKLDKIHELLDLGVKDDFVILNAIGYNYNIESYRTTYLRRLINLLDKIKFERLRGVRL